MTEIAKIQQPEPYSAEVVAICPLADGDAPALLKLYNYRNEQSRRTFRGLGGETTDLPACEKVVVESGAGGANIDFVAVDPEGAFVGWSFVWRLDQEENVFGLLVADHMQGRGLGRKLAAAALEATDRRGIPVVHLTVVTDNSRAIGLYRSLGFIETGSFCESDGLDYYRMQRHRIGDGLDSFTA